MSESIPAYIACAADENAFADCQVRRHGDLIQFLGHQRMDFAPSDARRLARVILALLDESAGDPLVDDVCADFQARSRLGQQKYGAKMTRDDLGFDAWLHHLKTELMDAILYAEAAIRAVARTMADGR